MQQKQKGLFNALMRWATLVAPICVFVAAGQARADDILNNEAVLKMIKAGLGESLVISLVQKQPGKYSLSPEELAKLKDAGVSEKILAAMLAHDSTATTPVSTAASVKVGLKTPVRLILDEVVSSKTAKSGDTFKLVVAEDVVVNGHIVIAKGAPATGRIIAIKQKSFANHNGSLEVAIDSARAVDGRMIAIEGHIASGGEGAGFGHFGKDAQLEKGYVVNAVVASEAEVVIPQAQ